MLDQTLLEQLKEVFSRLSAEVSIVATDTHHEQRDEFRGFLESFVSTSPFLKLSWSSTHAGDAPFFTISGSSSKERISFRAIPGGHEFTSLVLAVLNVDGKGKLPDEGVIQRIRQLKGPIHLTTYMSLSCENCPDVVQALNLMATLHPHFFHETVDGAFAPAEIESLGIQGVPSVIAHGKLIHSGKIQMIELLQKLEQTFGVEESNSSNTERTLDPVDVAVIGGGPAGASAAIYSVRKGLKVALIAERFGGQLMETKSIENMISIPLTEGVKLSANLFEHVRAYPVQLFEHRRVDRIETAVDLKRKKITFESGETIEASSVIIATGAKWRTLNIPGEKEYIGQGVAFCAHCDGPFYKGKKVAVVGGGNSGVEAAIDLSALAEHVTLIEYNEALKADRVLVEKLNALPNVTVLTQTKSIAIEGDGKKVTVLKVEDRKTTEQKHLVVDGVFVQIGLSPNTQFLKDTLRLTPYGEIVVDEKGRTSEKGIYAAGDVTTIPFKQIILAMGDGAKVALTAFEDRLHSAV